MNPNKIHGKKSQFWRESIFFYKNQYISKVRKSYRDLGAANDSTLSAWQLASRILPQAAPKGPKKFAIIENRWFFADFWFGPLYATAASPPADAPHAGCSGGSFRTVLTLGKACEPFGTSREPWYRSPNTMSPAGSIFSNVNLILPIKQPLLFFFNRATHEGSFRSWRNGTF